MEDKPDTNSMLKELQSVQDEFLSLGIYMKRFILAESISLGSILLQQL